MSGIYADPASKRSTTFAGSAAEKAINAVKSLEATEVRAAGASIRLMLEQELGRALGDDETFMSLDTTERMTLSDDVLTAARELELLRSAAFEARGETTFVRGLDLQRAAPDANIGYEAPESVEDAARFLIDTRVAGQDRAIRRVLDMFNDSSVAKIAADALEDSESVGTDVGALIEYSMGDEDLQVGQLLSQQWNRFHDGDLDLRWDAQKIEYISSMYNRFVEVIDAQ
jgi:hypothetical protein